MKKTFCLIALILCLLPTRLISSPVSESNRLHEVEKPDSAVSLREVVVKTERRIAKGDTLMIIPTDNQKKYNINGYELLRSLMLPGIQTDVVSGSVSTTGGQSVMMLLNGRPVERQDILMVRPKNVLRIEYLQELPPEYAYSNNAGGVINIVTKPIDHGYDIGLQANNALTTANGANIAYGRFYKKNSEFTLSYANDYTSVKKRSIDNIDSYNYGNEWHTIDRHGIYTPLSYNYNVSH